MSHPDEPAHRSPQEKLKANPLAEVSATAYVLGILSGASLALSLNPFSSRFIPLSLYLFFIGLFHFLEYYITATYQGDRVTADSFVLDNPGYALAHTVALTEFILETHFVPHLKSNPVSFYLKLAGLLMVLAAQGIRTLAMKTAGKNFSHVIQNVKESDHVLIKHGIYAHLRHPSYFGFFYWALGTQLLLSNPLSFCFFVVVLYRFFSSRIAYEEAHLISFFGKDYIEYRNNVPIGIPFINRINQ